MFRGDAVGASPRAPPAQIAVGDKQGYPGGPQDRLASLQVNAHDRVFGTHTPAAVRWDPDLSPRDVSTVHSTGDHPSPPTHQTSQVDNS